MALHSGEKPFGLNVEDRLKKVTNTSGNVHDDTHKPTHTHNHKHTPTPKVRERKTFRAQILTYPSLIERLDEYARLNGLSRAEAFEKAVSDFLERNT
jgi:hypothetical protein